MFENFMSEGRGQQPLWPSAGINNVSTRVLSQGGMKISERKSERRASGEGQGRRKRRVRTPMLSENVTDSDPSHCSASGCLLPGSQGLLLENLYSSQPQMLVSQELVRPAGTTESGEE